MGLTDTLFAKASKYAGCAVSVHEGLPKGMVLTPGEREAMRLDMARMLDQNAAARNRSSAAAATRYASR